MERRVSLNEIIRNAGIAVDQDRQPCLPAPSQPAILASEEDHAQARNILLDRRVKNPENKGVLKNIFRSGKDKEKSQDLGQFTQDELDQALSAVIRIPSTGPGLIQAFLGMGAKVNIIEATEKKKKIGSQSNTSLRRRSTVLQQAATLRRADSVHILASSGADQTTLDEGLKAALTSNDHACIQELLRHGADINKFPNALANAVRSNDQNFVRLILRAPKSLKPEVISSCLPAAVQQQSHIIVSLLITYGADPNFDSSSALNGAIGAQDYKLAVALVAGPIPLSHQTLQRLLDTTMRLPTRQATLQFLQLLFCCGLPPNSIGLSDLLICTVRNNDTVGAKMMLSYGVPTTANEAECLREAILNENWTLVDAILETPISPQHASLAIAVLPARTTQSIRKRIILRLVQKGATGLPLGRWMTRATQEHDLSMLQSLVDAGGVIELNDINALQAAVENKDIQSLRLLLGTRPSSAALSKLFANLRNNYSPSEKRDFAHLLLEHGAQGPEVDQALVDAIEDTSASRDAVFVTDLVHSGADLSFEDGKALRTAVLQADVHLVRLICNSNPPKPAVSAALPLSFGSRGLRHSETLHIIEMLSTHPVDQSASRATLEKAIDGGATNIDIIKHMIDTDNNLLSIAFEYTAALEDTQTKAPILKALLSMGVTQEALDQALAAETQRAVSTKDTTSTKLLLAQGASVSYNNGEALVVAVASGSSSLTTLLLSGNNQPLRSSITKAFRALFAYEYPCTRHKDRLEIARKLLSLGVDESAKDSALRTMLSCDHDEDEMGTMVDLLLQHDANVDTGDGACFVAAAQKQDSVTFEKLLLHNPSYNIIVPSLLTSKLPEEAVFSSLKMCLVHDFTPSEIDREWEGEPLLITAMTEYPRGDSIIRLLLEHGLDPQANAKSTIDVSIGLETVPALLWALSQPQKRISDAVITALLEAGASVNRAASTSDITALMLAAREGRYELVSTLLERGSDADGRDVWNHSALFYASHLGSSGHNAVQVLAPHSMKNDGSLHEAARNLQKESVAVLIRYGHDPSFPSRLHGGRNVLGELCLQAQVTTSKERSTLRQILRLLLDNRVDPSFKVHAEKTSILLAMDNPYSALPITEALLETEIWQDLNDDSHIYHDHATNLCYSPLSYIERLPLPSRSPSTKTSLLSLLRDKGCHPKYYSTTPLQPVGATGMPPPIAKLVDLQRAHDLALHHEKQLHEERRSMQESQHRDTLRRARETQATSLALSRQKHDVDSQRLRDAEATKRAERRAWHALVMEQEREAAAQRLGAEERKASVEGRAVEARKAELEHRAALERRMIKEKEDMYERNVVRQKDFMRTADESAKLHAKLRQERPAIESNGLAWGNVD